MKWFIAALGALYALIPLDIVPDLMVGVGWLDDLLLLGLIWYWFFRAPGSAHQDGREEGRSSEQAGDRHQRASSSDPYGGPHTSPDDPYGVLGLPSGASQEAIRAAYRRLAAQYHPDKVAHLGPEFQLLAESKFKVIQGAYDALRSRD